MNDNDILIDEFWFRYLKGWGMVIMLLIFIGIGIVMRLVVSGVVFFFVVEENML